MMMTNHRRTAVARVNADEAGHDALERAIALATQARDRAYAPYSRFRVGAAVLTADGQCFLGANVENASYGLTACAERIALWTGAVAGMSTVRFVVVVTDTLQPVTPCGACRQVLSELAPDAVVVMVTVRGQRQEATVGELLPGAFGQKDLSR
jgi:cytidine deaminase